MQISYARGSILGYNQEHQIQYIFCFPADERNSVLWHHLTYFNLTVNIHATVLREDEGHASARCALKHGYLGFKFHTFHIGFCPCTKDFCILLKMFTLFNFHGVLKHSQRKEVHFSVAG